MIFVDEDEESDFHVGIPEPDKCYDVLPKKDVGLSAATSTKAHADRSKFLIGSPSFKGNQHPVPKFLSKTHRPDEDSFT